MILCIFLNSINAVGVDIAAFSAMAHEEEVLLLPGLPLVNYPGENPEPDLWTFEVETPGVSASTVDSPSVMIDYVHPGTTAYVDMSIFVNEHIDHLILMVLTDWHLLFHDKSWRRFSETENHVVMKNITPSYTIVPQ